MTVVDELIGSRKFDYVIVGGGTAGCVVASRLAEALPRANILVIEGGANDFGNESILNLKGLTDLWGAEDYDYGYTSVPQPFGKKIFHPVLARSQRRRGLADPMVQETATSPTREPRCWAAAPAITGGSPLCPSNWI